MKKYILFCLFFIKISTANSQTLYSFAEVQSTQPRVSYAPEHFQDNYYSWQWLGYTGKKGLGVYLQASQEPVTKTVAIGISYSKELSRKRSIEWGIGPGIEFVRESSEVPMSISGYGYYETHTEATRKKSKFVAISNIYYSKNFGLWTQSFATYSVLDFLSVGVHIQTDAAIGPRLQLNFSHGFSLWGAYDLEKKTSGQVLTLGFAWQKLFALKK